MHVLGLLWIPDIIAWLMLIAAAIYIYGTWNYNYLSSLGYVGPKPKPFLGNSGLLLSTKLIGAWYLTGKQLYGKVYSMYEGKKPTIVVFDTEMLKQILNKEFSSFQDRRDLLFRGPILSRSLFDLKKKEGWRRVRNLTTPFFTTNKLKNNLPNLEYCVNNLKARCDKFAETNEQFEIKDVAGAFSLEVICLTAFGVRVDSQKDPEHRLLRTAENLVNIFNSSSWPLWVALFFPFLLPIIDKLGIDMWPKGSMDTIAEFTLAAIKQRETSNEERPDFIQTLLQAHAAELDLQTSSGSADEAKKHQALTDVDIAGQGVIFIIAGFETTATAISFLMFNLATHPVCQDKLAREIEDVIGDGEVTYEKLKDMTYLDMCIEESQRLYPPIMRIDRKCLKDTTVNGYYIPKGATIVIPVYGIHHDPEIYAEPETFNPERFSPENRLKNNPYAYLAFGGGPRNCVGMRLAQLEIKMATIKVLQNFRVKVGERTKLPLDIRGRNTRVPDGLWLRLEKRQNQQLID